MTVGMASGLTMRQLGTLTMTCNALTLLNSILMLNTVNPCIIQTSHSKTFLMGKTLMKSCPSVYRLYRHTEQN